VGALEKLRGKLQSSLGHRKIKVGKATDDHSLEAEGQREQESGELKQSGED